jgi:alkaline phosphatase
MSHRPLLRVALPLFAALATIAAPAVVSAREPADGSAAGSPRSVILIIGDGMDDQQITIARDYLKGAGGRLLLDEMPVRGAVQILTTEDRVDGKPVYVADSANTATSMATGAVTSRGRISTTAGSDRDLPTIVELASAAGLRTGIVTTSSVTDATPAAFASHVSFRLCEAPDKMVDIHYAGIPLGGCPADLIANGGPGSISEQLATSSLDVLLGGGSDYFAPTAEGSAVPVLELARQRGFQVVTSREELENADAGGRLLGLFAPSTLPVRLQGQDGRTAEPPRPSLLNRLSRYLGSVTLPEEMRCEPNPKAMGMPSLARLTEVALTRLSENNPRGFFLMVESASIDKQAHERKSCGSIGELAQLEEALAAALAFAREHPDTLVLVTADHAQAAQLVPAQSLYAAYPIPIYSPGAIARIRTPEGGLMVVNYATSNFSREEHTGAEVPLFSNAAGLGQVPAFLDQPALYRLMRDYLGLQAAAATAPAGDPR